MPNSDSNLWERVQAMQAAGTPEATSTVHLEIFTADSATEIYLIDAQFQLVAKSHYSLTCDVGPGVYKIKVKAGYQVHEEMVLVAPGEGTKTVRIPALDIPSAAPFEEGAVMESQSVLESVAFSARARQSVGLAAEQHSLTPHIRLGTGSSLYFFTRNTIATPQGDEAREQLRPFGIVTVEGIEAIASRLEQPQATRRASAPVQAASQGSAESKQRVSENITQSARYDLMALKAAIGPCRRIAPALAEVVEEVTEDCFSTLYGGPEVNLEQTLKGSRLHEIIARVDKPAAETLEIELRQLIEQHSVSLIPLAGAIGFTAQNLLDALKSPELSYSPLETEQSHPLKFWELRRKLIKRREEIGGKAWFRAWKPAWQTIRGWKADSVKFKLLAERELDLIAGSDHRRKIRVSSPFGGVRMPEDQKPLVRENPLAGFFLSDLKGKVLVDFGVQGLEGENHEWGACHVAVTPGVYRLQQRFKGKLTEQTIVASPGWQTQWFGVRCHDSETMAEASIFMSPEGAGYKANNPKNRRSETGRQALARGRAPLSDELVDKLLNAKFSDPMMGLYGVHMLLQRDPSRKDLRIPVQNLRLLLGAFHPDVECLAQLAGMGNPDYVMDAPPILRRSWSLALQATVENPKLVPHGSLAEMGTARVLNREPWLLTCYREDEALEQINRDRQIQLEAKLRSYLQEATLPGRLRRRGTVHSLPRRFTESVQMADEKPSVPAQIASTVDQARKLFHTATEYVAEGLASAAGWWREKLSKDEVTQLVETLGVPRGQVEALLNRLTSIPPAKEVNRESQAVDNTPAKSE